MSVKVSVVVPVFNPGDFIDPLIGSLLRQSMPASDFEAVFVDDGSTDETPKKLDRLAEQHGHIKVIHIPNSGWPGKPRNIGIEAAVGEYIQFVDNDDELGDEALERLYEFAKENRSDVVVGKEVRRPGKWVLYPLFEKNRARVTLEEGNAILTPLTPHKMFRRAFLNEHQLRFPEGPRRLEDHPFVVGAYFHADVISVLSDYSVYYWVQRADKSNAGARPREWREWYGHMQDALDVVEANTEPGGYRDRLLSHWYKSKGLKVGVNAIGNLPEDDAREVFAALRELTEARFPPSVDEYLPAGGQIRSTLVRAGDFDHLRALAQLEAGMRLQQELGTVRPVAGKVEIKTRLMVCYRDGAPVMLEREGDRVFWRPPIDLGEDLPREALDITDAYARSSGTLVIRNRATGEAHPLKGVVQPPEPLEGSFPLELDLTFAVDPETAASGHPLSAEVYQVHVLVNAAGWGLREGLSSKAEAATPLGEVLHTRRTVLPFTTGRGRVALDVNQRSLNFLNLSHPDPRRTELTADDDTLHVDIAMTGPLLLGRPLAGRLRLVPQSGGRPTQVPCHIEPVRDGRPARIRASIPGSRFEPKTGIGPGRWGFVVHVDKRRAELGLVLDIGPRGGAALLTLDGTTLSRVPALSRLRIGALGPTVRAGMRPRRLARRLLGHRLR